MFDADFPAMFERRSPGLKWRDLQSESHSKYLRYVVDHNLVKMWIFLNIWDTPCCCNVLGKMMINYWILDAPQFGENPHGCASKTSWAHFILFWTLNHLFWVLLNFAPHQHPMTDHLRVAEQHTVIPNWC